MDLLTHQYYSREAENFFKSTVDVDMSSIYEKVEPLLKPKCRILDAGCGSGRDAKYFMKQGFQVEAFDGSLELCSLASKYLSIEVKCAKFEDIEYYEQFDAIWACASLLHLTEMSLNSALDKLGTALVAKGLIYCSFKHGEGEGIRNSRFFNFQNIVSFSKVIDSKVELYIQEHWVSSDNRPEKTSEEWFNVILRKI